MKHYSQWALSYRNTVHLAFTKSVSRLCGLSLILANVEKQSHNRQQNEYQRISQTPPAVVTLRQRVFSRVQILCGDLQTCLNILIYKCLLEAVDSDARLGQRIARLILL